MKKILTLLCMCFLVVLSCDGADDIKTENPEGNITEILPENPDNTLENESDDKPDDDVDDDTDDIIYEGPQNDPGNSDDDPKEEPAKISFTAFGDWGDPEDSILVANALDAYCQTNSCDFNLDLGDSFNSGPPSSINDPRWTTEYEDVFGTLDIPFYVALGNHDVDGDFTVLLDYTAVDSNWIIPDEYYTFTKPDEGPFMQFFILNSGDFHYENDERAWLEDEFAKSTAKWKILVTHVPVISNDMEHGDDDGGFNYRLVPSICGKFDFILSGHAHIFSHLSGDAEGCTFNQFIISTGGMEHYDIDYDDPRILSTGAIFGFGWFEATKDSVTFKMIDTNGQTFYQTIHE